MKGKYLASLLAVAVTAGCLAAETKEEASVKGKATSADKSEPSGGRDLTKLRKEFLSWKFGMFIHFNMSTFVPGGWSSGKEDPKKFNPDNLDMGQWADAAKSAHMKYAVLTVKHTGGWCLWPSECAIRSVKMFTNYKNGKGDLVKEFCEAFRKRGLKVGFYYCFPLCCPTWAKYGTLPVKGYATGKAPALEFVKEQFKELLTGYGKIDLVWIDQTDTHNGGLKYEDWEEVKNYIHSLQPDCVVIANNQHNFKRTDISSYEYPYSLDLPPEGNTVPSEVCDKLQNGWFSNPTAPATPVRDVDYIVYKMLLPLNDNNSNYLLNCGPDHTGRLNDAMVAMLKKIGKAWNPNDPKFARAKNPAYGIIKKAARTIPNKGGLVAVTFDPSVGADGMEKAMGTLAAAKAKGVFFMTGEQLKASPETARRLAKAGNGIGNAAKSTKDLTAIRLPRLVSYEVSPVQSQVQSITRVKPLAFRAPYGKYNEGVWNVLNYFGLVPIESSLSVDASTDIDALAAKIKSGDIINFKDKTAVASKLAPLLKALKAKGLKTETLRAMLQRSTSKRLLSVSGKADADVVSGME